MRIAGQTHTRSDDPSRTRDSSTGFGRLSRPISPSPLSLYRQSDKILPDHLRYSSRERSRGITFPLIPSWSHPITRESPSRLPSSFHRRFQSFHRHRSVSPMTCSPPFTFDHCSWNMLATPMSWTQAHLEGKIVRRMVILDLQQL